MPWPRTRKDRTTPSPEQPGGRLTAGQQLSQRMAQLGLNQNTLAEMIGCSQPHVSGLESGDIIASPELAAKIEEVTRLPASVWAEEAIARQAARAAKKWAGSA